MPSSHFLILDDDPDTHASLLSDKDLRGQLSDLAGGMTACFEEADDPICETLLATKANWYFARSLLESLCIEYTHRFGRASEHEATFECLYSDPLYVDADLRLVGAFAPLDDYRMRLAEYAESLHSGYYYSNRRVPQQVVETLNAL